MMQRKSLLSPARALPGALALSLIAAGACTGVVGDGGSSGNKANPSKPAGNAGQGPGGSPGAGGSGPPGSVDMPPIGAPPTSTAVPTCSGEEQPGPRRLRLLTRAEY